MAIPEWQFHWYFGWELSGCILCFLLFATLTFGKLDRHVVVKNLLLVFATTQLVCCLLFFARQTDPSTAPNPVLCLIQAALVVSSPAAQGMACLMLTFRVLSNVAGVHTRNAFFAEHALSKWIEIGAPWFVWFNLFIAGIGVGISDNSTVSRHVFYCSNTLSTLSTICILVAGITASISIICVVLVALLLIRSVYLLKHSRYSAANVDLNFVVRVIPFGLYLLMGLSLAFAFVHDFTAVLPDLFICTDGVAAFIILGSQRDVLEAWGLPKAQTGTTQHSRRSYSTGTVTLRKTKSIPNQSDLPLPASVPPAYIINRHFSTGNQSELTVETKRDMEDLDLESIAIDEAHPYRRERKKEEDNASLQTFV